jgi:spermidine synthase
VARTATVHPHATSKPRSPNSARGAAPRVRKSGPRSQTPRAVSIGEDSGRAALLVDGVVQSISPLDGLIDGGYWAAMVPGERIRRALILGLGGGTLTRLLQARWGDLHMVGVDDDQSIVETANAVGWLPPGGLEIVTADAFEYVQTCQDTFDYVAVDLFRGDRLAGRAFGKPFLRRVRELLEPQGRLAFNMFLDHRAPDRIERIALFFDVREQVGVGGNVVVHARRRRG